MKIIYLASDSKARKKILQDFGLKFKVLPSHIRESRSKGSLSFSGLAQKNALEKAKAAGKKVKSGLIIAADTFVVQGKTIFGKPKDIKDARRMLKKISRKPQWLYTGIAVIDKDRKKTLVGCEKTKIYMDPLNDKEISAYFAQVNPLDKAGSFDIQGRGAFFIRRIEGCFYNVVGLPVYKLFKMLQKLGVVLYCALFVLSVMLAGCTTEYNIVTGEEESYMYSTDKEVQMGEAIDKEVENQFKMVEDPLVEKRVEDIGKKIAAICDRKDIDYHFRVLEDEEVNAFSLPGGYVYVNKGLVEKCANDDELAGVIGHEVGHIVARHSIKKLQAQQLYAVLMVAAAGTGSGNVAAAADQAFTQIMLGYSREDELLADQLGTRYARLAGYNPKAMVAFLTKLQDINRRRPLQPMNYFKTHPYVPDRIRIVKQELGQGITFNDYINIEQLPHQKHDEQAQ